MKKINVFGDSFSTPFNYFCPKYVEYKGYEPKNYGELISEKLNIGYRNHAWGGWDNYSIFHSIIKNMNDIEDGDIIIIGWSNVERYRVVTTEHYWRTMSTYDIDMNKIENFSDISTYALTEFLMNRTSTLYLDELNSFINIVNILFKNCIIIHWSWMQYNYKVNFSLPFILYETIFSETNGKINDHHYNEKSVGIYTEIFLNYIENKKNNIV